MGVIRLPDREVGEALVLPFEVDTDITGATVTARVSLNGATASEHSGALGAAVNGEITTGSVVIPGTSLASAGLVSGVVVITKGGADWSPMKERFEFRLVAVP